MGPTADAPPDGPPLRGFGEPCTDKKQCESNICLPVGPSGQCSRVCPPDCPDGYGCIDVTGAVIEGQVSSVCVPTSNQLCTPCTADSECTLLGMDKCVTYPDGDRACARDCRNGVGCPVGYACQTVNISGSNYQQCMPTSGACDCTAANPGAMQPCNIMTPWNVCIGAQTCGGAGGWGTCQPPSTTDDPDDQYTDSNCDGLDGDRTRAIFVASGGSNVAGCGLDYNSPCQTISFGISRAVSTGRPHIYVQNGTYGGGLTMVNGVSVYGGYDFNWKRNAYSAAGHTVTITGGAIAVRFTNITAPTILDNVIVEAASAGATGASSIGVLVTSSQLVQLRGVLVKPGAGGPGVDGTDGTAGGAGTDGAAGRPGCENSGVGCSSCARPLGGAGGTSACGRVGGTGGQPGLGGGTGLPGSTGVSGTVGGSGALCGGLRTCAGYGGGDGANGANGTSGGGGGAIGSFSGSSYVPANGADGTNAAHGNAGGGGGGGGGGDDSCDSYGSSGGGGGGGGCGGTRGLAGTGGGGSFGVVTIDSQLIINASIVTAGNGGNGGRGGNGGAGGAGGNGGAGGPYGGGSEQDDGGDGAPGGHGGNGGNAGNGGGGGGGPSIAVVCLGTSTTMAAALGSTLNGGVAGAGGANGGAAGMSTPFYGCPF